MKDYLTFNRMITPVFIQIIFWLFIVMAIIISINSMIQRGFWYGLMLLIISPIIIRVGCEVVMVFFRMQENLTAIKENVTKL